MVDRETPQEIASLSDLERMFADLLGYQKAIDCGVDMVLLCTPPGFRPMQFEAAVKAGKQISR